MQAVILIGIQASGKTTFYQQRFARTHVRINLDMLHTRHRERILLDACIQAQQSFVVDNTNASRADRQRYIAVARPAGFEIVGYYFVPDLEGCKRRNAARTGDERIPVVGILNACQRLEPPTLDEGFDALYDVAIDPEKGFVISER